MKNMHITSKKNAEENNNGNILSFNQLWVRYYAHWPLFICLLVMAVIGASLYLALTPKLYESEARILINDEKKGTEDSKGVEAFNLLDPKKIIENETEVVESRTLIDEAATSLCLYAPVFANQKFRSASAYATSPVKIEIDNVASLKETKKIKFTYDSANAEVVIDNKRYQTGQWLATPFGTLKFLKNDHLAYDNAGNGTYFFQLVNLKRITGDIQNRLKVASVSKLSTILDLTIRDEVPERGDDILNALLKSYNNAILSEKNTLAANTLSFVQGRLAQVSKNLDSTESKIQKYKASNGAIDIGTQGRLFLENVSANDQKISEINMQLAVLDQVETYVQSKENKGSVVPSTMGINDVVLSQLLNKLYETELEYEKVKNIEAANYPTVISLTDQIEKLKPSILENIRSQRTSLEVGKANLQTTNNTYSQLLQGIPEKERELIDINREQTIKNSTYAFLLQKREETVLSNAAITPDNRIIDSAQSSLNAVSPNEKAVYGICLVAAIVLGISMITIKETFSSKVLYRHEIEALTMWPVIGEIINDRSKLTIVTGEGKNTFVSEQFRQLRVAISFLNKGSKKKKILVTSAMPGEGKSFVAINLALTLAIANKKVVLVELDLINPGISSKLDVERTVGVSDYLGGNCSEASLINKTGITENLSFISSGPAVQNPSELLANGRIRNLLDYLEANFDYVIIDSPPVNLVTDAYIISSLCDVTLYIIRHNRTPKLLVQRIDGNNKVSRLNNIAIVFNGVAARGFVKNKYGYGYGYGYVYNEQKKKAVAY